MANVQVTIDTVDPNGDGINPAWIILRSEREDDAVALKILVNAIDFRFNTKRGTFFTDPGYGLDLEDLLGSGLTAGSIERLGLEMVEQVKEDERVADASIKSASKVFVGSEVKVRVNMNIVPRIGEPFALSTTVDNISASVLLGTR